MNVTSDPLATVFSPENLDTLFPTDKADQFFEALYGDASEGAYDIRLTFLRSEGNTLFFEFLLTQRPGKCLACNLTYGLPKVFERHPIINLDGLARGIESLLDDKTRCVRWQVRSTREHNRQLHALPVTFTLSEIPKAASAG